MVNHSFSPCFSTNADEIAIISLRKILLRKNVVVDNAVTTNIVAEKAVAESVVVKKAIADNFAAKNVFENIVGN